MSTKDVLDIKNWKLARIGAGSTGKISLHVVGYTTGAERMIISTDVVAIDRKPRSPAFTTIIRDVDGRIYQMTTKELDSVDTNLQSYLNAYVENTASLELFEE